MIDSLVWQSPVDKISLLFYFRLFIVFSFQGNGQKYYFYETWVPCYRWIIYDSCMVFYRPLYTHMRLSYGEMHDVWNVWNVGMYDALKKYFFSDLTWIDTKQGFLLIRNPKIGWILLLLNFVIWTWYITLKRRYSCLVICVAVSVSALCPCMYCAAAWPGRGSGAQQRRPAIIGRRRHLAWSDQESEAADL